MLKRILAASLLVPLASASASEVVGSWTLESSSSASYVTGSPDMNWLNTTNLAVSVNDAFSGLGILERGWANIENLDAIEFVFSGGILNGAGNDFVMLDAQFDQGAYSISTNADGFTSSINLISGSFIDTGESRDYFYGANDMGPFHALIFGSAFDLSDLGISLGDSVTTIRVTAINGAADPIGLGAIVIPSPSVLAVLCIGCSFNGTRRRREQSRCS